MHDTTQCIVALERDLFWVASSGAFVHTFPVVSPAAFMICTTCFTVYAQASCPPTSSSGQLGNVYLPSSSAMSLFRRSLITWSPGFTSGDFIFNPVTAGSGVLEIGARQLNNWRLHEPPDFLPFCQPGALSTRLYCSLMPRHHFRLPGRYTSPPVLSEDLSSEKTKGVTSIPIYVALAQNSKRLYFLLS